MSENPKMEKTEQKKTTKKAQRKQKKSQRKNGFGYAFIQTKYGKRILITQGENKIWLREEDLIAILNDVISRAFKYTPPKTNSYD